jgi:large conductance mechanosensitive channel
MAVRSVRRLAGGFKEFISQYSVMSLAVAVVIGNAVNDLVKSVVENLITPLISLISPQGRLQGFEVSVGGATFGVGEAINSAISFLVISAVVYVGATVILKNEALLKEESIQK